MFLCKALQHMQNDPSVELHVCFKRSYDEVLRHHHTFVVRSLAVVRHFVVLGFQCAWSVGLPVLFIGLGRRQSGSLPPRFHCSHLARRGQGEVRYRACEVARWT